MNNLIYTFTDIFVLSLPLLHIVLVTLEIEFFGAKSAAMIAWMTMVVVAATLKGGWVTSLLTEIPGWVSLNPLLGRAALHLL